MQEPILDLRFGGGTTLVPVDFADDIYQYLHHLEIEYQLKPEFLQGKVVNVRMRQILVDWMFQLRIK